MLLSSALGKILAKTLVFQKGLNLFSSSSFQEIPNFSEQLAKEKSFDAVEFLLFVLISFFLFGIFFLFYRKNKFSPFQETLVGLTQLIFAFFVYISVSFANHSGTQTILIVLFWIIVTSVISLKVPKKIPTWEEGEGALANGIVTGFYLLILFNGLTTSIALPLSIFAVTPIFFYLYASEFDLLKHPGFIFLVLSFVLPFNKLAVLVLGLATVVGLIVTKNKVPQKLMEILKNSGPFVILFIFLYNPIFYLGNFDSVEEGFWAGWLQRMLGGEVIYRDFAAYHPPTLPWGLYLFTKIFGPSLYNLRLFFHLLQIIGLTILYFVLDKLVTSKFVKIASFILILAYTSTLVRNNMEIRLATGVLPLLLIYLSKAHKKVSLVFAGVSGALSLLISIETGVASLVSSIVVLVLYSSRKNVLKTILQFFYGALMIFLPVIGLILLTGSLDKFFEYITYYPNTFSQGFQNIPITRPELTTILQWYEISNFFQSSGFLWELVKISLIGALFLVFIQKIRGRFREKEILLIGISVFGLVLARSALARSDYHHIVFVWIVGLLLVGYFLDTISKLTTAVVIFLLIFFVGKKTMDLFLQRELTKFQTYGNPSGTYPSYKNPRSGILTGIDARPKDTDDLVDFIKESTSKDGTIFVFPQAPEIYFLADRKNATSFDTPITFFTKRYQEDMLNQLRQNNPRLVIYNPKFSAGGILAKDLKLVDEYIDKNFVVSEEFGDNLVMVKD